MDNEGLNATAETVRIDLEGRRLAVDEAKLKIEQARVATDGRFFARHMGEVIAGAIALAGVTVSATSVVTAFLQKDRELAQQRFVEETASHQKDRELEQQRIVEDGRLDQQKEDYKYKWKLDMLQFVERHANDVFSDDSKQMYRMQQIMLAAFPPDDVTELFVRLKAAAHSKAAEKSWQLAHEKAGEVSAAIVNDRSGYVYLGQWQNGSWLTHNLDRADAKPLMSPQQLLGARLRVAATVVNLRSDVPDAKGNNRPNKGVLHRREEVMVVEAPLYNTGLHDSGFIWVRLEAAK